MAIPEGQLETWSHIGSIQQSAQTYDTIRNVLNDSASPYYAKDFSIFLQGSYGNATNVYKDSDVDVVICLNQTYYAETKALGEEAKANYNNSFNAAPYQWGDFRTDVLAWLQKQFGAAVTPGTKAIYIKGSGMRRDADVLVCAQHRRYLAESDGTDGQFNEGICFWSGGNQIINFPKQHADSCTTKHQDTNNRFKPVVRMYKNMRNRMVEDGSLKEGLAPSYFVEGMLWNVPAVHFGATYENSFINTYNWILQADKTKLACANDLFWLIRENSQTCWATAHFDAYFAAVRTFWEDWT